MKQPHSPLPKPRRRAARSLLVAALALAGLTACVRRPDYVLDDDRMTRILLDVHRAEGLLEVQEAQYKTDAERRDVMGAVLVRNGVSRTQYDSSLVWYGQHLRNLIRIYDRVSDSLKAEREAWQALMAAADAASAAPFPAGDSVALWRHEPYAVLDARRLTHFRAWRLAADTSFRAGDSVAWRLRVRQLAPPHYLVATLAWTGEGDSVVASLTEVVRRDTLLTLGLAADSTAAPAAVLFSLALLKDSAAAADVAVFADSISAVRLRRP